MPERKKPAQAGGNINIDLGFGSLFKGLGDFMDIISELAETETGEKSQTGEFQVKGLGDQARGVYGFSVRTGIGGIPQVERFGNIRKTDTGPIVADVREPLVDVFDEGHEIVIVVELPGVTETDIQIDLKDDILSIETTGSRKYAKEILLSEAADASSLQKTYTNGILELRLKKAS
jgi:HSP20 family protein